MSRPRIKSIKQIKKLKNKTVLVRCDFDVPIIHKNTKTRKHENTIKIVDDTRLQACVPTIKYLLRKKVKQIILIGHLGRPKGIDNKLSLEPVAKRIQELLGQKIKFIDTNDFKCGIFRRPDFIGAPQNKLVALENLRFNPEEKKNDKEFAKKLAGLADIYVNEAFAVSHRSEASIDAIQNHLPSYAGLHLEQEINHLSQILSKPKKPLVVIIGGAKIETKLPVIKNFLKTADYILIGGGVANNFLKARGIDVGDSLIDKKYINQAKNLLNNFQFPISNFQTNFKSQISNSKIVLPIDWKAKDNKILDIGPKTIILFNDIIKKAKTIVWNGPMGYFENKNFASGTNKIAEQILKNKKAKIIIGGGETIESINSKQLTVNNKIFISTGGGAMLEYLSGKKLPGLKKIIR